jgi:hypothetical protein
MLELVHSFALSCRIVNGICRTVTAINFRNTAPTALETSFLVPRPPSSTAVEFTATYKDVTKSSGITRTDPDELAFDDAIAEGNFACSARLTPEAHVKLNIARLLPADSCKVTVTFVSQLSVLQNAPVYLPGDHRRSGYPEEQITHVLHILRH